MKTIILTALLAIAAFAADPVEARFFDVTPSCAPSPCTPNPTGGKDLLLHSTDASITAYVVTLVIRDSEGHKAAWDTRTVQVVNGWAWTRYLWDAQKFPIDHVDVIALKEAFRQTITP